MSSLSPYLMYLVFAAGAAAVYFRMPRGAKSGVWAGVIFGAVALAGFFGLLHALKSSEADTEGYFYLFSAIAILAAVRVVTHARPIWSALYFILVVISVAALAVLTGAQFLAIALVIVYAGAILVTYLFVIMLAQQPGSPVYDRRAREPLLAVLAAFVMTGIIAGKIAEKPVEAGTETLQVSGATTDNGAALADDNTLAVGRLVMTRYMVVLEISGVLLLVSMIGAVGLSRKKIPSEVLRAPASPLGQVGKEVEPF